MTATIAEIQTGLKTALQTISGLEVYDNLPDSFSVPCAMTGVSEVSYHESAQLGNVVHSVDIMVLVARPDEMSAQSLLNSYMSTTGALSVRAAIEADRTLGGIVDETVVEHSGNLKVLVVSGVPYISVDFTVTVYA